MAVGAISDDIARNRQQLREWRQLPPATGMPHLPAQPIYSRSQRQAGCIVSRCREPDERSCQGIGFIPPGAFLGKECLMHVRETRRIDAGAQEDEACFGEVHGRFWFWQDDMHFGYGHFLHGIQGSEFRIGNNCGRLELRRRWLCLSLDEGSGQESAEDGNACDRSNIHGNLLRPVRTASGRGSQESRSH